MPDKDKTISPPQELDTMPITSAGPLVFISHDSRDADLAEAFSKLLKSVTSGLLKSFRSSDKKGTEGIEFGDEWYKRLMEKLQTASDVVCLFTERSLDRPWILYEAGVAKGKRETPVHGIALGVPLSRVSSGPFFQFNNCDADEDSLTKLVLQLARKIPGIEPDTDVVRTQVKAFKATAEKILEKLSSKAGRDSQQQAEDNPMAKFLEEMKGLIRDLPSRVAERMSDIGDPFRKRRSRRFHPMMLEEMMHIMGDPGDPMGFLLIASMVREEIPWFYEIALEVYHAIRAGDHNAIQRELERMRRLTEFFMHGPFIEEMGFANKETHIFFMEFPHMFEKMIHRCLETKKPMRRRPIKANE